MSVYFLFQKLSVKLSSSLANIIPFLLHRKECSLHSEHSGNTMIIFNRTVG